MSSTQVSRTCGVSRACRRSLLSRLAAVLMPAVLMLSLWSSHSEAAPLFGLAQILTGTAASANSTSLLGLLALQHLQNKIDTFTAIADFFALAGSFNASATVTGR